MQNKFKQSKFYQNMKENRAVYITAVVLLMALAVIVAATAVANRSKKPVETDGTGSGTETEIPPESTVETKAPDSTDVMDLLPTFSLPVSGMLIKSHDATTQVFSNTMQDYRVHLGVDIATEMGAPVMAAADGIVMQVWEDVKMGQCVAIKHGGDACTVYKNLSETIPESIVEGAEIKAGETLGYVGESAMVEIAEEPHLHFEMTVGGLAVDPLAYFEKDAVATLAEDDAYESSITE